MSNEIFKKVYTEEDGLPQKVRFKLYEDQFKTDYISHKSVAVMRLDGVSFGNFTESLKTKTEPFNKVFEDTMIECAKFLQLEIRADFVLVGSDEFNVIRLPRKQRNSDELIELPYSGCSSKLDSIYAGLLSAKFTMEFNKKLPKFEGHVHAFDCRAFNIPDEEVLNYLMWRQTSLRTNAISAYADIYIGKKASEHMNSDEKIKLMLEHGFDYESSVRDSVKYGTLLTLDGHQYSMSLRRSDLTQELINKFEYNPS